MKRVPRSRSPHHRETGVKRWAVIDRVPRGVQTNHRPNQRRIDNFIKQTPTSATLAAGITTVPLEKKTRRRTKSADVKLGNILVEPSTSSGAGISLSLRGWSGINTVLLYIYNKCLAPKNPNHGRIGQRPLRGDHVVSRGFVMCRGLFGTLYIRDKKRHRWENEFFSRSSAQSDNVSQRTETSNDKADDTPTKGGKLCDLWEFLF